MALSSSRLAIGNALKGVLAAIIDPATNNPIFALTKLGAVYDPGVSIPFAQVVHYRGQGKPAGSGGNPQVGWRIDDSITWIVTCGFGPYQTDDSTAQSDMLYAHDIVLPALHTHFQLPTSGNPSMAVQSVYSVQPWEVDTSAPLKFPNGNVFLLWHVPVTVKQQYNVLTQIP